MKTTAAAIPLAIALRLVAPAAGAGERSTSHMKVDITDDFCTTLARMRAACPGLMPRRRHLILETKLSDKKNRPDRLPAHLVVS